MMDATEKQTPERPGVPYLPFETFKSFIDGLSGGRPLPPRIDRSLMSGMAGGTQTLLLGTLTTFGLIADDRTVLLPFRELVHADAEQRQEVMRRLLHQVYADPMKLSQQHATADQLAESFRLISGYQGSTLRKAITFFLNMARYAQVELSPFFRAPAQKVGVRKGPARRPRSAVPSGTVALSDNLVTMVAPVESRSVDLASGGTITVSCSVSFLSLRRSDRDFVFDLVDRLDAYVEARGPFGNDQEGPASATQRVTPLKVTTSTQTARVD